MYSSLWLRSTFGFYFLCRASGFLKMVQVIGLSRLTNRARHIHVPM